MYEFMCKLKTGMNYVLARLCAVLLSAMTLLVLYQVFTRYFLNDPASFTEELVRYLLIWTGFIGAAYAFSTREHMALLFVRDKFDPPMRKALTVGVDVIIMIVAIVIMIYGGVLLAVSAEKEFSALLGIPRSLVYAMGPIAGVLIVIAQIINIYEDITGLAVGEKASDIPQGD